MMRTINPPPALASVAGRLRRDQAAAPTADPARSPALTATVGTGVGTPSLTLSGLLSQAPTTTTIGQGEAGMDMFESFVGTRSRALWFPALGDPHALATLRHSLVAPPAFVVRAEGALGLHAVFKAHAEAVAALAAASYDFLVVPALERDVVGIPEPLVDLARLNRPIDTARLPFSMQHPFSPSSLHLALDAHQAPYTLSSNPPNPKTSFRANDWICPSSACGAHNFARNAACFNCRAPRARNGPANDMYAPAPRLPISPRFAAGSSCSGLSMPPPMPSGPMSAPASRVTYAPVQRPSPAQAHHVLTPSGRTFAQGGKVQNVSSDPTNVIFLFWPANESLPQQGQLRPPLVTHFNLPPIMNTGAKGPVEHQPGDWVCGSCQYLNWRRRKVCQACFPYAEGNGDSVSTAMQAERIALLASALSSITVPLSVDTSLFTDARPLRSAPLTPPMRAVPGFPVHGGLHAPVSRSQSQFDLRSRYAPARLAPPPPPIYQTSGRASIPPSPLSDDFELHFPCEPPPSAFLPAFLSEIVDSPTLSASSGSAELSSLEDFSLGYSPAASARALGGASDSPKTPGFPSANIWGLDGDERKAWSDLRKRSSQDALIAGMRQCSL